MSNHIRVPMLPGSGKEAWAATVNGAFHDYLVESNAILLDVLRDQVGTLGVKRGCDMGTCGCCAVLIEGEPRLSCLCLAKEHANTEITTVEGLADGHHLHPIQQCFADAGGSQCGFCTPGFLIVASAFLEQNPEPSRDQIKCAIEGNLCRCTGYQQIVDAVEMAANMKREGRGSSDGTGPKSDPHPVGPDEPTLPPGSAK
jgi:aerobic-type carbon monoxide dehydrogenase small subunit (CoxS/CutS family)